MALLNFESANRRLPPSCEWGTDSKGTACETWSFLVHAMPFLNMASIHNSLSLTKTAPWEDVPGSTAKPNQVAPGYGHPGIHLPKLRRPGNVVLENLSPADRICGKIGAGAARRFDGNYELQGGRGLAEGLHPTEAREVQPGGGWTGGAAGELSPARGHASRRSALPGQAE